MDRQHAWLCHRRRSVASLPGSVQTAAPMRRRMHPIHNGRQVCRIDTHGRSSGSSRSQEDTGKRPAQPLFHNIVKRFGPGFRLNTDAGKPGMHIGPAAGALQRPFQDHVKQESNGCRRNHQHRIPSPARQGTRTDSIPRAAHHWSTGRAVRTPPSLAARRLTDESEASHRATPRPATCRASPVRIGPVRPSRLGWRAPRGARSPLASCEFPGPASVMI